MYFTPKDYTSKITYLYCWAHWNNSYYSKVLYWFYTVVVVGDTLGNSWNSNSNFGQRNQLSIEQMKRLLRGNNVAIDLKLSVTFWIKVKCYIILIYDCLFDVDSNCVTSKQLLFFNRQSAGGEKFWNCQSHLRTLFNHVRFISINEFLLK